MFFLYNFIVYSIFKYGCNQNDLKDALNASDLNYREE